MPLLFKLVLILGYGFSWFLLVFRVGFSLFTVSSLLICCEMSNLYKHIVGSSLNSIQIDLNHEYGEVLNTYEDMRI
jgi:hypothetical protein